MIRKLQWFLPVMVAQLAFAQGDGGASRVDSVLDRLEKRLLDEESEVLTFGERELPGPSKDEDQTAQKIKMPKKTVEVEAEETARLRELASAVAQLESQIEQLSSDTSKTRQRIMEEARVDNFVSIEARLTTESLASIRSMRIRLDGYDVYEVSDEAGLWLPSSKIPVYNGPLQPGSHRLDVEVRLVLKQREGLPLNSDVFRMVSQSFELKIPDGKVRTRYLVNIAAPKDGSDKATATLETIVTPAGDPASRAPSANEVKEKSKDAEKLSSKRDESKKG